MSIGPLASLAGSYLQSIFGPAPQSSGTTATASGSQPATGAPADNSQISPFAQLLNALQQTQQSNPAQYQQLTQQISANLQSAAQTAQANGNTNTATELNTLSTDFKSASQNNELPNIQDLAKATSSGHHHHHAHSDSTTTQSATTNPMSIILNTLSSAGIGASA